MAVQGNREGHIPPSSVFLASDEDVHIFCEPCDRGGPRLPAYGYCKDCKEHLCESCFHHHKRATLSRYHTLLDKGNMPQTQQRPITSVNAGHADVFIEPCARHKDEMITFYCHAHRALLCRECVPLEHTVTTCKVDYIPDISRETVNSQQYHATLQDIKTVTENWKNITEDTRKMIVQSNNSIKNVLEDIKKFRKEINQKIDKLEKQAVDAVSDISQSNDKSLKAIETNYEEATKSLKIAADSVDLLNTSRQAERLFVELEKAENLIKHQEDKISQVFTSGYIKEYKIEPNKDISSLLDTENLLGTLTCNALHYSSTLLTKPTSHLGGTLSSNSKQTPYHEGMSIKPNQQAQQGNVAKLPKQPSCSKDTAVNSRQPVHHGEISVKTSQDVERCWITGMTLLTPARLVVTDYRNRSLKLIDTLTQSVKDQIKLSSEPYNVSLATSNELAVTMPTEQTIQFISASIISLAKLHTLKVDGKCRGISCYQDKIVVSFDNPGKLQILDIKGKILTTVKTSSSGADIFKRPNYIQTSSSFIYVSDSGNKAVIMLDWQGQVTCQYTDISRPEGLAVHPDGSLYACGINAIHLMSEDGTHGKTVLKVLTGPLAVCWCNKENKLYHSSSTGEDKHDNFIQVFRM
ncbi:uncharacterized protein LOC123561048 isoform X2 [Mercenaria mercenaria]|nr:uncharacterized protein LOC123561048 isoform X2 [Mercenaria mercenaria]XP_045209137.2 uncharacterized protein LOC123561048 isoform X2 [Mercenaria mercenaria]